jgi:hypothetical protein
MAVPYGSDGVCTRYSSLLFLLTLLDLLLSVNLRALRRRPSILLLHRHLISISSFKRAAMRTLACMGPSDASLRPAVSNASLCVVGEQQGIQSAAEREAKAKQMQELLARDEPWICPVCAGSNPGTVTSCKTVMKAAMKKACCA